MVGGVELRGLLVDEVRQNDHGPLGVDRNVSRQRGREVILGGVVRAGVPAAEPVAEAGRVSGLCNGQTVTNRDRSDGGAAHGIEGQGMIVEIVVDLEDGVDRLAVSTGMGLDGSVGQEALVSVDSDMVGCGIVLDNRGDGGVLLGAQVLDLSVGKIIGAVGQLLDVQDVVADINVADRGGRQFKLGVDGLVCFQNRCEVILLGEFGVGIPANERVLVLGRVSGSCNCIAVADRDRVDGGAAVGFEGQGMLVEIILDIDRQTLFDLDVLLRVSVVGRIVRAVVLRGHGCERFKLAAQRFDLSVCLVIGAVGQLLDVADGVVVGVAGVEQLQNQRAVTGDVAGGNRAGNCAVIGEVGVIRLRSRGCGRVGRALQILGRIQSIGTIEFFQIVLNLIRGVGSGFPLCSEDHIVLIDGVGCASCEHCIADLPALEVIAGAGRSGGQVEAFAVNIVVVIRAVGRLGHTRDIVSTSNELCAVEQQRAGQLVAVFVLGGIAGNAVVNVGYLIEPAPVDLAADLVEGNVSLGHELRLQLCEDIQECLVLVEAVVLVLREQRVGNEFADGDEALGVVLGQAKAVQRSFVQLKHVADGIAGAEVCVDVVRGDGVLEQNIRPAVDRIGFAERPLGAVLLVPVGIAAFGRVERIASDIESEAEAVQELNNVGAIGRSRGAELRKIRLAFKGLEDHDILFGLDIDLDIVRSLTGLMFAIGRADGVRLVILKDHSGVGSGSLLDLLRLLHCFCLDGVEIDVFTIKSGNFIGIEILVLIVSRFAVHIQLGNDLVGLLFPVRVQVRPAVDGLAGDVPGLAFAAPEGEGVALAGRGGRVCGGQSRANAGLGGMKDALRLGVVVLICRQRFQRIEVNDGNQLGDDELEILPVAIDLQLGQRGGFVRLFAFHIVRILVEPAVVVPAAVDLEVKIEIAVRIDLRKVNRIASKLIGGVRNIHDRLAQIAGLEDHEVDVGLFGLPLCGEDYVLADAAVWLAGLI